MRFGWGAYIIDEWVQGDNVSLLKNPNYFRAGEGLPVFENVIYRFVGENSNANIARILSGECDIVDQTSGLDDQSELLLELQAAGQVQATFVTGTTWEHVDFGIQHIEYDDGSQQGTDRPDFFSDLRVREALAACMDRQALVDTILFGQSIVIDNYIPPQHPLYNPDVKTRKNDFDANAWAAPEFAEKTPKELVEESSAKATKENFSITDPRHRTMFHLTQRKMERGYLENSRGEVFHNA